MSNSTFYADGYRDGYNSGRARPGRKSPPDVPVYAAEYLDGFRDGDRARTHCPEPHDIDTEGWCDDVNPGRLIPN